MNINANNGTIVSSSGRVLSSGIAAQPLDSSVAESNSKVPNESSDKNENGVSLTISKDAMEQYNEMLQQQLESDKAAEDAFEDTAKLMEIARRISAGDRVPASDEKRLMEYSFKLYQTAKAAAIINAKDHPKEYESMFDDEEENEDINAKLSALDSESSSTNSDDTSMDVENASSSSDEGSELF